MQTFFIHIYPDINSQFLPTLLYKMLFVISNRLPSFVSDFLHHETCRNVFQSQNELLPVSCIIVIFKRSDDLDIVYQTTYQILK